MISCNYSIFQSKYAYFPICYHIPFLLHTLTLFYNLSHLFPYANQNGQKIRHMNHRKRQYTVATEAALILRWKQMRSSGIQYRQASEKKSYEIKISNKKCASSGNAGLAHFLLEQETSFPQHQKRFARIALRRFAIDLNVCI